MPIKKRSIPTGRTGDSAPSIAKRVQLKITLRHSQPSIWRRVVVPGDICLAALHYVIQAVMGWDNSHPHLFAKHGTIYSFEDLETGRTGKPILSEGDFSLEHLAPRVGATFAYEYDFGDGWWHDLKAEKVDPMAELSDHALCLGGANAAPPDDSGGVWGYYAKLDCLADPQHSDYQYVREWFGEDFDPAKLKREEINRRLARLAV